VALATRNLYLVLKARDEASRVVRGFGRELSRAQELANAQSLRQRANLIQEAQQRKSIENAAAAYALRQQALQHKAKAADFQRRGMSRASITGQLDKMKKLNKEAQELTRANNEASKATALFTKHLRNQADELENGHKRALQFSNALHQVSATIVTAGAGLTIAGGIGVAIMYKSVEAAQEYARQVALTKTQVDGFSASLDDLSKIGLDVASKIAVPFEQIQPALYNIFSSTNANLEQAKVLLTAFGKAAVAGQVSIEDAAKGTISIMNAFNIPFQNVNQVLDIQFQLVRKGVGTYDDFQKVFGRVVPSATRAQQSFEEVGAGLAYLTRNGLSAAMASTSFARALDALSNPKAVAAMEGLNIKVRDLKGNMLPVEDILSNLQKYLLNLPNKERIGALVDIFKGAGGTIQARRFLDQVLLRPGELDEYKGFLNDMKQSQGQFGKAYETMSNTVAAQTELLKNKFKVFQVIMGQILTPVFVVILQWLNKVLDKFNQLSPGTQKLIIVIFAAVSVFSIFAGLLLVIIGVLAGVAAAIAAAGAGFFILVGGVVGLIAGLAALGAMFIVAMERSKGFRDMVGYVITNVKFLWTNILVPFAREVKDKFEKDLAPALGKFADMFQQKILPQLQQFQIWLAQEIMPRVKELANWVKDRLGEAFKFIGYNIEHFVKPTLSFISNWYESHKETIQSIVDKIIWFATQYGKYLLIVLGVLTLVFAGPIIAIIIAFVAVLLGVVMAVTYIIEAIKHVINWFSNFGDHMKWLGDHIGSLFSTIGDFFGSLPTRIKDAVGSLAETLINSGRELIDGLIKGVRDKFPSVGGVAREAVNVFKSFWPFSPAKQGPLAGKGSMFYSGQKLIQDLNAGIASQQVSLAATSGYMAGTVAGAATLGPPQQIGNVQQTFNINTQEINPRRHSQELGFMIAQRV